MSTQPMQKKDRCEAELAPEVPGIWAYSVFKGNFHFKDLKGRKPAVDINDEAKGHDVQELTHLPLDSEAQLPCGGMWPLLYYPQGVESAVERLDGRNGIVITEERGAADGQKPERFHSLDEGEYYWTRWCNFACTILAEGPWRIVVRYKSRANEELDGEGIEVHVRDDDLGEVVKYTGGVAIKGCAKRSFRQAFKIHIGGHHLADRPHMLAGRVCFYFDCPISE